MVLEDGAVPDGGCSAIGVEVGTSLGGSEFEFLKCVILITEKFLNSPPITISKLLRSASEKFLDRASMVDIPVAF